MNECKCMCSKKNIKKQLMCIKNNHENLINEHAKIKSEHELIKNEKTLVSNKLEKLRSENDTLNVKVPNSNENLEKFIVDTKR